MKNTPIPIITENIFLEGVLQTFDYKSNGRIYDSGIFDKALKRFMLKENRKRKLKKILKEI